ncbi:hypothetical protein V1Y59_02200 [Gordonia sp. PKS22-38]|uniref:Uncharacterized protein n=1 Tax=Gordonia prachuapensis TaxID=3115651 RepID=A0ABU7MNI8_9ACTN|nr:hypothetical protein [Gordonia sp. PKS22-38]
MAVIESPNAISTDSSEDGASQDRARHTDPAHIDNPATGLLWRSAVMMLCLAAVVVLAATGWW